MLLAEEKFPLGKQRMNLADEASYLVAITFATDRADMGSALEGA
jgi:hypothetical protein